jgi:hypothetical protein
MKAAILFAVLGLSTVYGQKITIEADDSADFSRYKTFRMNEGQLKAKGPALNNDLIRRKLEDEIRKRLTEKGLKEVSSQPDLNVRFTLTTPRRTEVDNYPAGPYGRANRRVKVQYVDGTLTIDLRDATRRELVWQSVAVQSVDDASKLADRLDDMVKKSIDKYPPKKIYYWPVARILTDVVQAWTRVK